MLHIDMYNIYSYLSSSPSNLIENIVNFKMIAKLYSYI